MNSEWMMFDETQNLIKEINSQIEAQKTGFALGEIWSEADFNRRVGICQGLQAVLDYIQNKEEVIL